MYMYVFVVSMTCSNYSSFKVYFHNNFVKEMYTVGDFYAR